MALEATRTTFGTNWTIGDSLNERRTLREAWEKDFNKNYQAVADAIAKSVIEEVFSKLKDGLTNPYKIVPTPACPVEVKCWLDITYFSGAQEIEKRAGANATLAPFKGWLDVFLQSHVEAQKPFFKTVKRGVETNFFLDKMSVIGHSVTQKISSVLQDFSKQVGNASLRHKVEWHREAEKRSLFGSLNSKDNYINVEVWIENP